MSSSDSYYGELLDDIITYLYRYVTPVLYILGNIGNFLSIFVFFKKSWRKNVCVFYFKILLFISLIYLNSVILSYIFVLGFNINLQNTNILLCKLFYYVPYILACLLPTVLILASVDRLLISSQNVDTRLYSSKRLAYFSVSISTFFWIIFNIHVLVRVNLQEFYPTIFFCYFDQSKLYLGFLSYSAAIFNVVLCLVIIILCVFAFKNVRRIREIPRQQRNQIRSMTKKDFQLLRCLYIHNIVYITISTVICIVYVYDTIRNNFSRTPLEQEITGFLQNFFNVLYSIVYSESFFIFIIVSKAFRYELKRAVYKIFGKNVMPSREEDNKQQHIENNNVELNIVSKNIVLVA